MSSTQSFSIPTITSENQSTYLILSGEASTYSGRAFQVYSTGGSGYGTLNEAAMRLLFPNGTAHPTRMTGSVAITCTASGSSSGGDMIIDGTNVASAHSTTSKTASFDLSSGAATSASRASSIQVKLTAASMTFIKNRTTANNIMFTAYFTRYDFSASTGSNVTSASVSSSTGYDGDTIKYRCTLDSGAEWQGWYKDGALYSATKDLDITVSGSDLTLEARATMPIVTKTLSATYNGAQLQGFPISVQADVDITYGGISKGTVPFSGGAKTLMCAHKLCNGNIGIGGKMLQCTNKLMTSDIVCQIS